MKDIIIFSLGVLFLTTCLSASPVCKPRSGKYYLTGIVYCKKDGIVLSNKEIVINDTIVKTDSIGRYVFIVLWESECKKPIRVLPKHKNKDIEFTYKNTRRRVKNIWKQYAFPQNGDPPSLTQQKDIYF